MQCTLVVFTVAHFGPASYDLVPNDRISPELQAWLEKADGGCVDDIPDLDKMTKTVGDLALTTSQYNLTLPQGCTITRVISYYD